MTAFPGRGMNEYVFEFDSVGEGPSEEEWWWRRRGCEVAGAWERVRVTGALAEEVPVFGGDGP